MSGALGLLLGSASGSAIRVIASAVGSNFGSSVTINKPTGVLAGDLLVGIVGAGSSTTWTGDSGWTEVADYGLTSGLRVAWKVAGGSEPSDYTFSSSGSAPQGGVIIAYRNAAFGSAGAFAHSTGGADLVMPSVTLTNEGILLALCIASAAGRTFSAPVDMLALVQSSLIDPSFAIFTQSVGAGATGSKTSSPSSGSSTGILIGIKGI